MYKEVNVLPILMKVQEKMEKKIGDKSVDELKTELVQKLHEFLDFCKTDYTGSKFSIMGPAGKLLNLVKTTGKIDWGKVKGYITNVIRINQNWVAPEALELLEQICDQFKLINENLTPILWLNLIEGIDYELFFQMYKIDKQQRDKYITETFRKYLQEQFKDIEAINKLSDIKFKNFEEILHPREFPVKQIINDFWEFYKKDKKERKEPNNKENLENE